MAEHVDAGPLWLGACVGAQLMVVFFCVIKANAYRERPLLLHAAASLMAVVTIQSLIAQDVPPRAAFLLVPALAGLQLLDLVSHAGGLRRARRWLLAVSAIGLPLLAAGSLRSPWFSVAALVLWSGIVVLLLVRAWHQSQPWIGWLVPAQLALVLAGGALLVQENRPGLQDEIVVASLLVLWTACTYLATGWRGRLHGETRARVNARNTIDPLTGLATPLVLAERVHAARHLTRRYGHPSVLMLVDIENLPVIARGYGLEAAESAVLAAAARVREALMRDGDVAARLAHARIGVLAEGAAPGQAAATIATRILAAGLKEPLVAAPGEYLRFRIVLGAVPVEEVSPKTLLHRLNVRMDQELADGTERRIVTLSQEELQLSKP